MSADHRSAAWVRQSLVTALFSGPSHPLPDLEETLRLFRRKGKENPEAPMKLEGRAVRLADVARAAGVSPGTASKALHGSGSLRPATRERVRAAAEVLGFVPGAAPGPPRPGRRPLLVGLMSSDDIGRFSLPVMLGAENALTRGEISALLATARRDSVRERHHLTSLLARGVDGIIVTGKSTEPREPLAVPVPVVYALSPSAAAGDMSVVPDDAAGMRLVVDHLRTLGHRRVAHIGGRADRRVSRVRAAALREALAAAGMELAGAPLFGEWSESWGRQATDLVLRGDAGGPDGGDGRGGPPVTALVCASDQLARAAGDRLRERGFRVPGDIAVTGYDNWDVMGEAARPPLTTVDMELEQLGRRAAERLLAAIAAGPGAAAADGGTELVPPRLVVRGSTIGGD